MNAARALREGVALDIRPSALEVKGRSNGGRAQPGAIRVLNRWLDAPTGYLASIANLLRSAAPERRELLAAVQEETDQLLPGHRIYRAGQDR